MGNNSVVKTLLVAIGLCIFFSVVVSSTAVGLKPLQLKNRELDKKKNILSAAGIKVEGEQAIEKAFKAVKTLYVELPSGDIIELGENAKSALKEKVAIDSKDDIGKILIRSKYLAVYILEEAGSVKNVIIPIVSKGLWSTMYAFMALEGDANTISGLEYYIHAETPGLGAEVTNPKWKSQWPGKKIYNGENVAINMTKPGMSRDKNYDIDGISGATITSVGVANSLKYWLGEAGFKSFLTKLTGGQL